MKNSEDPQELAEQRSFELGRRLGRAYRPHASRFDIQTMAQVVCPDCGMLHGEHSGHTRLARKVFHRAMQMWKRDRLELDDTDFPVGAVVYDEIIFAGFANRLSRFAN